MANNTPPVSQGRFVIVSLSLICTAIASPAVMSAEVLKRFEFRERRMGVDAKVIFYAADERVAKKVAKAAFSRLADLDRKLSDWKSSSELMQLCLRAKVGEPRKISRDLFDVLQRAQEFARQSKGAFDVTVGPVVRQWRRARRQKKLPDAQKLRIALASVGFAQLRLDARTRTATLAREGMRLDLGGIAKGFAGDAIVRLLKQRGIRCAMIDFGGDVVLGDPPPGKKGWRIGIAPLKNPDADPTEFLLLANCAVATSGDAYQFVEINGTRYSHIVDPKTGLGLTTRITATVIAPNGTTADALASAICVMGPADGPKLIAATKATEARTVRLKSGKAVATASAGWARFVKTAENP